MSVFEIILIILGVVFFIMAAPLLIYLYFSWITWLGNKFKL